MGVIGAGTMGVGISYVFAAAGYVTHVVEPDERRVRDLQRTLTDQAERGVQRGKLSPEQAEKLPRRVTCTSSVEELPEHLDAIIESVPERLALKQEILAQAEQRRPALLATNTSSLSIALVGGGLRAPALLLGMHFFNPVWSLPLVELICAPQTAEGSVAKAQELVAAIGKESIVVRDVPGFATSRLDLIAALEAMRMLEGGVASAEDIDRAAVLAYRHPVGPLRLSDIVGLDVRLDIAESLAAVYGERFSPPQILRDKVEAGELGQKSGRGFYPWP